MRKIFFAIIILLMVSGCKNEEKKETVNSNKSADMKALYEKNLAVLKGQITAFEKEDLEAWASPIADSAHWDSPAYGDTLHTKAHWKESIKFYMDNWSNLKLNNPIFLPGMDTTTHEMDGSVRYYGQWAGVHSSGVATNVNYYGSFSFNNDNKIIRGSDYFDLGGLMNTVSPKKK